MPCPKPDDPFSMMIKYGRKEATVFTGFCKKHDNDIFMPIENNMFNKSDFHVFLYIFRCFAVEYHKKQETVKLMEFLIKNSDVPKEVILIYEGEKASINDFKYSKTIFDSAILNKKYDVLSSIVWEFDKVIKFAASGFEAPVYDLKHNKIQDLSDFKNTAKHIFYTIFHENNKTYFLISWLKENNEFFSDMKKQLSELTEIERQNYINNLLPIISENIVINPTAWDSLEEYEKEEFYLLCQGNLDIFLSELGNPIDRTSKKSFDLFSL